MSIITDLVNNAVSSAFSECIGFFKDQHERKEKQDQISVNLYRILTSEQENIYYDNLIKFLDQTKLLDDIIADTLKGRTTPNCEQRINETISRSHICQEAESYVRGVFKRITECVRDVLLAARSLEEARINYQIADLKEQSNQTQLKIDRVLSVVASTAPHHLCLDEISAYSEPISYPESMIRRHIVANDYADDNVYYQSPVEALSLHNHIAIVNDAGFGKTYLMYQIHQEANQLGYICVYQSLKKYPGLPLMSEMINRPSQNQENVILLLDGFDEVQTEHVARLKQELSHLCSVHPTPKIILTSRSNFYQHNPLSDFSLYSITQLSRADQEQYLHENGIDPTQFFSCVRERGLIDLCTVAFYFVEIVHLYQGSADLPDAADVMQHIIDRRISADQHKYAQTTPAIRDRQAALQNFFEKVAFVMQCTHQYSIPSDALTQIGSEQEMEQLRLHGLWDIDSTNCWSFSHNNFREYFAARWLNRHEKIGFIIRIIAFSTCKPTIKPSWMNVVAFLAKLRRSRDLKDWIAQHDPTIITVFERDHFSLDERFDIFKHIYDAHETAGTWANIHYRELQQLGAFVSCEKSVLYILDRLTVRLPTRQTQNLLRVLEHFTDLFGQENDCKLIISDIAFDDSLPVYVRIDALRVMSAFPNVFKDYTKQAADTCIKSGDSSYRYHLCSFIDATDSLDAYFDIIIHELEYDDRRDEISDVSRSLFLKRVFETITSPSSVLKVIAVLSTHHNYSVWKHFEKSWGHLIDVAINSHSAPGDSFVPAIQQLLTASYHFNNTTVLSEISRYIEATRTEKEFVGFILANPKMYAAAVFKDIMCPSICNEIINRYQTDSLDDKEILPNIIRYFPDDNEYAKNLKAAIFLKTGKSIEPAPAVDYEQLRKNGHQAFFNALFNKNEFDTMVMELTNIMGVDTLVNPGKFYPIHEKLDGQINLQDCYYALYRMVPEESEITFGNILSKITNWEDTQFVLICNEIELDRVDINPQQMAWFKDCLMMRLKAIDLCKLSDVSNDCYNYFTVLILRTLSKLKIAVDSDTRRKFLLLPSYLFAESDPSAIPAYIMEQFTTDDLDRLILYNIKNNIPNGCAAAAHLRYCTDRKLLGAKEFAIQYLMQPGEVFDTYSALHYLRELYGSQVIIDEIVPHCNNNKFLRDLTYHIPFGMYNPVLEAKIDAAYYEEPSDSWLEIMIQRNHRNALQHYYEKARENNGIPDMTAGGMVPELTESIRNVNDYALIDLVLQLIELCCKPGFVDKQAFGLRNSCWSAIKNMAATHPVEVKQILEEAKERATDAYRQECIDLLQTVDEMQPDMKDDPLDFSLATSLLVM